MSLLVQIRILDTIRVDTKRFLDTRISKPDPKQQWQGVLILN